MSDARTTPETPEPPASDSPRTAGALPPGDGTRLNGHRRPAGGLAGYQPAMPQLQITLSVEDACRVMRVAGEVDLATSDQLQAALDRALTPGIPLVVDLTWVGFFDAAGLRALLTAGRRAHAIGAPLRIVPSAAVTRVIELAGSAEAFTLYPDLLHALAGQPASP